MCRALPVAALEEFYHSCSPGLRFTAVATVQGADDAPNVLRVPSSPPLMSAPSLQRAVSRQHAECAPTDSAPCSRLQYQFWHEGAVCVPRFPPCVTVSRGIGRGTCAVGGIVLRTQSQRPWAARATNVSGRRAHRQAPVPSAPRETVLRHPARHPSWLLGLTGRPGWAECIPRVGHTRR